MKDDFRLVIHQPAMRTSNIRPFPPRPSGNEIGPRLAAAATYFLLGYFLQNPANMDIGLNLIFLMGILYWAFVHQKRVSSPYFFRLHFLQALVLFLFLILLFKILLNTILFLNALLELFGTDPWLTSGLSEALLIIPAVLTVVFYGSGIVLALTALLGKSFRIPLVTDNARYWA